MPKNKDDIENVNFIILEHLKAIRSQLDNQSEDIRDLKRRSTGVEENLVGVQRRLDHLGDRVARIEKRLELVEA